MRNWARNVTPGKWKNEGYEVLDGYWGRTEVRGDMRKKDDAEEDCAGEE